ncbi:ATP-dependent helicase [Plasmodium ovale wallikeri]|uniref:ATP-dependent RNA helicase n=1 Tax=Plasmodium ovale wallikeri TaxID=864142 RepID=A0A1A8YYC7_PLAOA|nr:ATP-dependent helicase [Plasmodium ovale wallikeri]
MKSTFVLIFQYNNLLSKQCYDIVKSLSRSVKVKTTNLKKGNLLNLSGSFILISSPVRFVTYMKENKEVVENFLNHLNFFIIDEVDVMFDKPYMKYISIVYEEIHKRNTGNIISLITSSTLFDQFEILELFKNSENPILVTTDIIHRGIDIKNITHLFHFDAPSNIIVYTHRNGRISRGASTGDIYMFNHSESLITKKIYELHKNNVKFEDIFSRKRSLRKNFKRDIKKSNQQKNIT